MLKKISPVLLGALCGALSGAAWAQEPVPAPAPAASAAPSAEPASDASDDQAAAVPSVPADMDMCLIQGPAPSGLQYKVVRKLKAKKNSYGSVSDILPSLVAQARKAGGTAIINYNGSQRFGWLPWQMIRPVATGTAVRWLDAKVPDCVALGGATLAKVLATNLPPSTANSVATGASQATQ